MAEERAQRRLAAILAADVVGYGRLMQADEAGTLAALKSHRKDILQPLIAKHHGRIIKLMGDGVLVEFGSAVNAVTCAVELQGKMGAANADLPENRRIVLRIGINLGDVIVEGSDLYGDGVNIAARLEALAEPGSVFVSQVVYSQVRGKLPYGFKDLGDQSLKNMAEAVRVYRVGPGGEALTTARPGLALPDKPSIAVLAFSNMSGDPEQEYFSDGITEDIITELSRFRSLFVIARNSSFAYKGRALDLREIGRNLGVRYVVEGSIRRAGNRARVRAQLIDASTGNHLWAEHYDRELEDIFSVQDEITRRIVTSIAPRIEAEGLDLAKRRLPEDMRAYDYYLRAKSLVDTPRGIGDLKQGREYCERAIEIDASFARAHAYRALSYIVGITLIESHNLDDWRRQAMESAETAVALDPMDGVCHWALSEAALHAKQPDRARDHIARALALNPNDADVLAVSGLIEAATGDPEAGLHQLNLATERNPSSPPLYHWWRGVILCLSGEFDEALHAFNRFGTPNPGVLRWRAATLVQLGRIDEARADVRALLAIRPGATISEVKRSLNYVSKLDHYFDNLRQADLPE